MIARILNSSNSFKGVSYNTNKTEKNLGELMKVVNFGYLQNISNLQPEEYKNYLLAHSAISSTKDKQFHVAISCHGKEYDKFELTKIADEYMKEMGYSENPYMVVYHRDTDNNHVHIVSSRIGNDGKKISDKYERKRSMSAIQKIMKSDVKEATKNLLSKASNFSISTIAQYKMLFEKAGYEITENKIEIVLRKYDDVQAVIPIGDVNKQIAESKKNNSRIFQLRAIIEKYKDSYSSEVRAVFQPDKIKGNGKQIGYTSDLAEALKIKFGIDIVFHGKNNLPPYAYTIIDNSKDGAYKGGEIMLLKDFIQQRELKEVQEITVYTDRIKEKEVVKNLFSKGLDLVMAEIPKNVLTEISLILKSVIHDYNAIEEGLSANKIEVLNNAGSLFIYDKESSFFINANRVLNDGDYALLKGKIDLQQKENEPIKSIEEKTSNPTQQHSSDNENETLEKDGSVLDSFDLNISNDVDDSQIHGRNRRREKKARINTR